MRNTVFNFYFAWIIRQDGRHPNKTKELVVPKTACTMSYCQRDISRVKHASITSTTKKKKEDGMRRKKKKKRRTEGGKVSLVSIADDGVDERKRPKRESFRFGKREFVSFGMPFAILSMHALETRCRAT